MITLYNFGLPLPWQAFTFPGGEVQVKLNLEKARAYYPLRIEADLRSAQDFMTLALLVDAWRQFAGETGEIQLYLPYLPYARQDRVCAPGEAFSLRVMTRMLNAMRFTSITIADPHSPVAPALLDNCHVLTNSAYVQAVFAKNPNAPFVLVAPDLGASKKVEALGKPYVQTMKYRNPETGQLSGFRVLEQVREFNGRPLLIVDDICDGGRTFVGIAQALAEVYPDSPRYLYVTHGIFSQGLDPLRPHFTQVFCRFPWIQPDEQFLVSL